MIENQSIPKGWEYPELEEVLDIQGGSQPPKSNFIYKPREGYVQLLQIRDFGEKPVPTYVPIKKVTKFCKKEDILVARYGASLGRIVTGLEGAYNVALAKVIDNYGVFVNRYLHYLLQTQIFQTPLALLSRSAQNGFAKHEIAHIALPLPPLPEQRRIVAKIEELFSSLDKGIESLKTAQQQLKVYRQAVLKWAFEGKLTNKNVKEGELPEGWKWLKLDDVVDEFVRGPFGGSLKKECFVPKGYKVYEQKNAIYQSTELGKYFINENKFKELIRFKVKPYDFIVSCSGTIGKLFMIPEKAPKGIINQALLIIRINRDLLLEKFFMHLFTSSFFQRLIIKDAKGTAMLNLAGVKDMKLVPVLLPPIREQQAIVAEIESRLSVCDKIEESIEQSLKQAEALRQSILKKAFEGKLVPQDPKDEPASKLLERISVEKEKTAIKKRSKN